jgi:NAD(P)-dependent dehydrogenase (short-subunit alcohol dehydrogenase family)
VPLPEPPDVGTTMLPANTFADQVVLVTGGGTGLGKATALELARCGVSVTIAGRR